MKHKKSRNRINISQEIGIYKNKEDTKEVNLKKSQYV